MVNQLFAVQWPINTAALIPLNEMPACEQVVVG